MPSRLVEALTTELSGFKMSVTEKQVNSNFRLTEIENAASSLGEELRADVEQLKREVQRAPEVRVGGGSRGSRRAKGGGGRG